MNDCDEGLAVHCLQPWVFTLCIQTVVWTNRQPFIAHEIFFRRVADGLCFPDDSVLGTRIFVSTVCVGSIANSFDQGIGKGVSC